MTTTEISGDQNQRFDLGDRSWRFVAIEFGRLVEIGVGRSEIEISGGFASLSLEFGDNLISPSYLVVFKTGWVFGLSFLFF